MESPVLYVAIAAGIMSVILSIACVFSMRQLIGLKETIKGFEKDHAPILAEYKALHLLMSRGYSLNHSRNIITSITGRQLYVETL